MLFIRNLARDTVRIIATGSLCEVLRGARRVVSVMSQRERVIGPRRDADCRFRLGSAAMSFPLDSAGTVSTPKKSCEGGC